MDRFYCARATSGSQAARSGAAFSAPMPEQVNSERKRGEKSHAWPLQQSTQHIARRDVADRAHRAA
ncbi:MAG: hypothetical protein ACI83P_000046 [Janthinobacterium sp.]|jgi:hypothetical protein